MAFDWNFWGSVIGSGIGAIFSFILAIGLVYFKDWKKKREENKKKKKLFEDLFNGFSKLYDNEGCILLFRTFPLILEEIQEKLQMITSFDYKKQAIYGEKMQYISTAGVKNPQYMKIWMYNHLWFFSLDVSFSSGTLEHDFDEVLYDMKGDKYFSNNPEILIDFLKYLEKEYRNAKIIGKKKILLKNDNDIIDSIKSHYQIKNED